MDAPVSPMSTAMKKNGDEHFRACFGLCCLFGEHQAQSMAREVVKDELVARRVFEKVLLKMDYQEVGGFVGEEMSMTKDPILTSISLNSDCD
jgi:hypothetical protein